MKEIAKSGSHIVDSQRVMYFFDLKNHDGRCTMNREGNNLRTRFRCRRSVLIFQLAYHEVRRTLRTMHDAATFRESLKERIRELEGVQNPTAEQQGELNHLRWAGLHEEELTKEDYDTLTSLRWKIGNDLNTVQEQWAARLIDSLLELRILARLLAAAAPRTVRALVNQSRHLCGNGCGQGSLLGWFLWERPDSFLRIKKSSRFPIHRNHSDERIEFLARSIAAEIADYKASAGDGHLWGNIQWCSKCRRPVSVDRRVCLHRKAISDKGTCLNCGACTHPNAKPGDRACARCGAELLPIAFVAAGQMVAQTSCPVCTQPNAAGNQLCANCDAELPTFVVRPHPPEECRDSTWPCPTHDVVLPDVGSDSGLPFQWCGVC